MRMSVRCLRTEPEEMLSGIRWAGRRVHAGLEVHREQVQTGICDNLIVVRAT